MKELRVKMNIYLELKEEETEEQAKDRLQEIFGKAEDKNKGLICGEWWESEIVEDN